MPYSNRVLLLLLFHGLLLSALVLDGTVAFGDRLVPSTRRSLGGSARWNIILLRDSVFRLVTKDFEPRRGQQRHQRLLGGVAVPLDSTRFHRLVLNATKNNHNTNNTERLEDTGTTGTVVDYVDDCFGLIFLTGLFVVQDPVFTTLFGTLSTVTLVATRRGALASSQYSMEQQRRLVPAMVALVTLAVSLALSSSLLELPNNLVPVVGENAMATATEQLSPQWVEAAVCMVSVLYGLASMVGGDNDDKAQ